MRTQDTWLSGVQFLIRWTKADNSRETLKSKNVDITKRSTNPEISSKHWGSKLKCFVLRGNLWLQSTCARSVVPSHSHGSSYTACSLCSEHSFLLLWFSSWCSHCLQSLPAAHVWKILSLPGKSQLKRHSFTKCSLISPINPHHSASHKWSSFTLNSQDILFLYYLWQHILPSIIAMLNPYFRI